MSEPASDLAGLAAQVHRAVKLCTVLSIAAWCASATVASAQSARRVSPPAAARTLPFHFVIDQAWPTPVIDAATPGAEGNKFGFEGGNVVKVDETYYLFTNELYGAPLYSQVHGAVWTSPDAVHWTRNKTLFTADWGVGGPHLWGPTVVFNASENRWNMFPILVPAGAYGAVVAREVSETPGEQGILGPYKEAGTIFQPDKDTQIWEGSAGTNSFFPFEVGDSWYMFYGSHTDAKQTKPSFPRGANWMVGLAEAPRMEGPWTRLTDGNPVPIEPVFIENPIVTRIGTWYVAIYDGGQENDGRTGNYRPNGNYCGYSCSRDGVHWIRGGRIPVQPSGAGNWADDIRTPLCLIPQGNNRYLMLYTAGKGGFVLGPNAGPQTMAKNQFWPIGLVTLRLVTGPPQP